jgi:hypothetical protein
MDGGCECGRVRIEASRVPPARFYCHCTTCQRMYRAPYGDITGSWSPAIRVVQGADALRWERHRWLPVSVRRGVCGTCGAPVLGRLQVPPAMLTFVPARVWDDPGALPPSSGHIFWQSRVADVDDDLPKVEGFWTSELTATGWMLPRLLGR